MKTQWFILAIAALLLLSACAPTDSTTPDGGDDVEDTKILGDEILGNVDDDTKEFLELMEQKATAEWKVAYDIASTYDGKTERMQTAMFLKGETKLRMDATVPQYGETRTYVLGDEYIMCTQASGSWSCTTFTTDQSDDALDEQEDFEESIEEDPAQYTIVADGTMRVAGVTATCFKITSDDSLTRYCFSAEGVPLYTLFENSDGRSEMTATSYATRVSDSDFVPPAEPTEFNAGGTMPAGGDYCDYCNYLEGTEKEECLASC